MRAVLCMLLLSLLSASGLFGASELTIPEASLSLVRILCDPRGSAEEIVFELKNGQKFMVHREKGSSDGLFSYTSELKSGEKIAIICFGKEILQMKRPDPFRALTMDVLSQINVPINGFDRFSEVQYVAPERTVSDDIFENLCGKERWKGLKDI